jgi:hypothetical protein
MHLAEHEVEVESETHLVCTSASIAGRRRARAVARPGENF